MKRLYLISLVTHVTLVHFSIRGDSKRNTREPYEGYLATKTPYRFIQNTDDREITYEGCNATRLWAVIRHGTRTPGMEGETLIRNRLPKIRDLIVTHNTNSDKCNVADFQKWSPHEELNGEKTLTHAGEDELIELGERFGNRFAKLLPQEWYNSTYMFRFTDTSRTKASAKHFATGLFGRRISNKVWFPEPMKKDPILRFYKLCNRWRKHVKKNPETLVEVDKFVNTELVHSLVQNVTMRLKLPEGSLNVADAQLIYTTCCFETAWDRFKKSPWCSIFTIEEFKILEYIEDLEYYWIDGYGHTITTEIACVMLKDVIDKLKSIDDHEAVFYFTHSGTILKFLSHLGLYRDPKPLLHGDHDRNHNRLWKTSKIDAFASNIAFIRFDCTEGPKVLVMHQERPVRLPGCPEDEDLCSLTHVEDLYRDSLTSCDFDKMCTTEGESMYRYVADRLWNFFRR